MKHNTIKRGGAYALAVIVTTLLCLFTAPVVKAGQQVQTSTNSMAVNSTNTFLLYGDVTGTYTNGETPSGVLYVDGTKTTQLVGSVGGFFTNTANASNVVFNIAASTDVGIWTNRHLVINLVIPATSTGWVSAPFTVSLPLTAYSLRTVENTNAGAVTARGSTLFFKAYTKTGI